MNPTGYGSAVKAELAFTNTIKEGAKGMPARRVQEWLGFHGFKTGIDADYGSATTTTVKKFQAAKSLPATGNVDDETWMSLTAPIHDALRDGTGTTLGERVRSIAQQHLSVHPIELGGANRGPWVRIYTGGFDGTEWAWCAGFVSSVLRQACQELGIKMPLKGSLSCDTLAAQAQAAGLFVAEKDLASHKVQWADLGKSYIFLIRRTPGDWTHTGLGIGGLAGSFDTVEGNSNNEGSSDGYEVCSLSRSAPKKDFIVLQ